MTDQLIVRNHVVINTTASKVWNALTNPEETKKYMFGCEAVSDWDVGSPLLWKGVYEDQEMIFVKGHIVAIQPERFLAYTTIDPNSDIDDISENYLTVTYTVSEENGLVNLAVTQGDYATVANGEQRYNDTIQDGGWESILLDIKQLLETDKS